MTVKRNRIASSSSFVSETRLFNRHLPGIRCDPTDNSLLVISFKVPEGTCQSPVANLTFTCSDESNEERKRKESDRKMIGHFLDQCGFCSRKLDNQGDLFMYGYLGAYCTAECRQSKMASDKVEELRDVLRLRQRRNRCSNGKKKVGVQPDSPRERPPIFHI